MTSRDEPRHSRAEVRDMAKWLKREGWTFHSIDGNGHSLWSHPKSVRLYSLPETPRHFNVQRARTTAMRLVGQQPAGRRRKKAAVVKVAPVAAAPVPRPRPATTARIPITAAERQAERDFNFYDSLMRRAPGGR